MDEKLGVGGVARSRPLRAMSRGGESLNFPESVAMHVVFLGVIEKVESTREV